MRGESDLKQYAVISGVQVKLFTPTAPKFNVLTFVLQFVLFCLLKCDERLNT